MSESAGTATAARGDDAREPKGARRNPFVRLSTFVRQVVAELRKVIWPTRQQLLTYTGVVLFFVALMVTIVSAFDFAFTQGVLAVFGK